MEKWGQPQSTPTKGKKLLYSFRVYSTNLSMLTVEVLSINVRRKILHLHLPKKVCFNFVECNLLTCGHHAFWGFRKRCDMKISSDALHIAHTFKKLLHCKYCEPICYEGCNMRCKKLHYRPKIHASVAKTHDIFWGGILSCKCFFFEIKYVSKCVCCLVFCGGASSHY